jgi:hypothetical protein
MSLKNKVEVKEQLFYCFPSSFFIYNFYYQLFTYHDFLKLIHRHLFLSNIVLFLAQQKLLALLDGMYRTFLENVSRLLFRHLFISLEKSKNPCNLLSINYFAVRSFVVAHLDITLLLLNTELLRLQE